MDSLDLNMMNRALELAERGRGFVEPNPLVGAVIVHDGKIVGEGWHERFGGPHAEAQALTAAGDATRGATLYVNLEPCCHQGKTPPCSNAIIKAGILRVVAAMSDPFPEVSGRGISTLQAAGIQVDLGVAREAAEELNAPYLKLITKGRPYVIAKWAMSLDGKIATATGESKWVTGEAARQRVHELRGRMDAIVVGIGTVLADNPLLTARPPGPRVPVRVILDTQLRIPSTTQIVRTSREAKVLVIHEQNAPADRRRKLEQAGCECLALEVRQGLVAPAALLDELGRRRFTNILVEGGAQVLGRLLDARELDEVYAFMAGKLIGGIKAPGPFAGHGVELIRKALPVQIKDVERLGDDWLFRGRVIHPSDEERSPPA